MNIYEITLVQKTKYNPMTRTVVVRTAGSLENAEALALSVNKKYEVLRPVEAVAE